MVDVSCEDDLSQRTVAEKLSRVSKRNHRRSATSYNLHRSSSGANWICAQTGRRVKEGQGTYTLSIIGYCSLPCCPFSYCNIMPIFGRFYLVICTTALVQHLERNAKYVSIFFGKTRDKRTDYTYDIHDVDILL